MGSASAPHRRAECTDHMSIPRPAMSSPSLNGSSSLIRSTHCTSVTPIQPGNILFLSALRATLRHLLDSRSSFCALLRHFCTTRGRVALILVLCSRGGLARHHLAILMATSIPQSDMVQFFDFGEASNSPQVSRPASRTSQHRVGCPAYGQEGDEG